MFTIEQIQQAHSKVKSGADFPAYIRELKALGVTAYETFVSDGHTDYSGSNNYQASTKAKYKPMLIAETANGAQFKTDLRAHQQGETDYPTFCADCAASGIEKWVVELEKMTCTYYDKTGEEVLTEQIPE